MGNQDRRRFARVPQQLKLEYRVDSPFGAEISDLGEGGFCVATSDPLAVGTVLQYKFYLPDDPKPIEGEARVVWRGTTAGMAVEFQGLSQEDRERIGSFVDFWILRQSDPEDPV